MNKTIKGMRMEKPARKESSNMLMMTDIIKGVNAVLNPGKPEINWFAPDPEAKAAIHIRDGRIDKSLSNSKALYGGTIDDQNLKNVKVVAYDGRDGGIYAEGPGSKVTVDGAYISTAGNGSGIGGPSSGAAVKRGASMTLKNAVINTSGRTRYSTAAEENATLRVYNSVIWSHGMPFGDEIPEPTELMSTPPPALEIKGNTRTHCTMSNSQSYFYNTKIICDGWAALSTESSEGFVYLEANDCDIICTKSGYGAYSDPGCHDVFNNCYIDTSCMMGIVAGNSDMTFNNCKAECGAYFGLMHCVNGWQEEVAEMIINGGEIHTAAEAFLIKSHNALIDLKNTNIQSGKGILVKTIINDDPCTTKVTEDVYGVNVRMKDMEIEGDLIHGDSERTMWVELTSTLIKGKMENVTLAMNTGSKWVATADSSITLITDINTAQIDAPEGVTITAIASETAEYTLASGGKFVVTEK